MEHRKLDMNEWEQQQENFKKWQADKNKWEQQRKVGNEQVKTKWTAGAEE